MCSAHVYDTHVFCVMHVAVWWVWSHAQVNICIEMAFDAIAAHLSVGYAKQGWILLDTIGYCWIFFDTIGYYWIFICILV